MGCAESNQAGSSASRRDPPTNAENNAEVQNPLEPEVISSTPQQRDLLTPGASLTGNGVLVVQTSPHRRSRADASSSSNPLSASASTTTSNGPHNASIGNLASLQAVSISSMVQGSSISNSSFTMFHNAAGASASESAISAHGPSQVPVTSEDWIALGISLSAGQFVAVTVQGKIPTPHSSSVSFENTAQLVDPTAGHEGQLQFRVDQQGCFLKAVEADRANHTAWYNLGQTIPKGKTVKVPLRLVQEEKTTTSNPPPNKSSDSDADSTTSSSLNQQHIQASTPTSASTSIMDDLPDTRFLSPSLDGSSLFLHPTEGSHSPSTAAPSQLLAFAENRHGDSPPTPCILSAPQHRQPPAVVEECLASEETGDQLELSECYCYAKAALLNPGQWKAWFNAALSMGTEKKSVEVYHSKKQRDPRVPHSRREMRIAAAGARADHKEDVTRVDCLCKVTSLHPSFNQGWYLLALCTPEDDVVYVGEDAYSKVSALIKSLELQQNHHKSWYALALYQERDDPPIVSGKAYGRLECLVRALSIDMRYRKAWAALAKFLLEHDIKQQRSGTKGRPCSVKILDKHYSATDATEKAADLGQQL